MVTLIFLSRLSRLILYFGNLYSYSQRRLQNSVNTESTGSHGSLRAVRTHLRLLLGPTLVTSFHTRPPTPGGPEEKRVSYRGHEPEWYTRISPSKSVVSGGFRHPKSLDDSQCVGKSNRLFQPSYPEPFRTEEGKEDSLETLAAPGWTPLVQGEEGE